MGYSDWVLCIKKKISPWGWSKTSMGHLGNFCPWKYSNPDWIRSWVTSSRVRGDRVQGRWWHSTASRGPSIIYDLWFLTFFPMSCGNTWNVEMGLIPGKPSKLLKGEQRLLTGNFRCVADNEGRKQRAVQTQWNSSCEFLNTNLLCLTQEALKKSYPWLCYRKTLYKACHYCFCRENYFAYTEIDAKWKISSFVVSMKDKILLWKTTD